MLHKHLHLLGEEKIHINSVKYSFSVRAETCASVLGHGNRIVPLLSLFMPETNNSVSGFKRALHKIDLSMRANNNVVYIKHL